MLKTQNWILPTCDSLPLIVSQFTPKASHNSPWATAFHIFIVVWCKNKKYCSLQIKLQMNTNYEIFLINFINILAKTIKYKKIFQQQFLKNHLSDLAQIWLSLVCFSLCSSQTQLTSFCLSNHLDLWSATFYKAGEFSQGKLMSRHAHKNWLIGTTEAVAMISTHHSARYCYTYEHHAVTHILSASSSSIV